MSNEPFLFTEDLTNSSVQAGAILRIIENALSKVGKSDLFQNHPVILDIGGGMGRFAALVNQNTTAYATSLDIKDIRPTDKANPVRASAYHLPFPDQTFDFINGRGVFDSNI